MKGSGDATAGQKWGVAVTGFIASLSARDGFGATGQEEYWRDSDTPSRNATWCYHVTIIIPIRARTPGHRSITSARLNAIIITIVWRIIIETMAIPAGLVIECRGAKSMATHHTVLSIMSVAKKAGRSLSRHCYDTLVVGRVVG